MNWNLTSMVFLLVIAFQQSHDMRLNAKLQGWQRPWQIVVGLVWGGLIVAAVFQLADVKVG